MDHSFDPLVGARATHTVVGIVLDGGNHYLEPLSGDLTEQKFICTATGRRFIMPKAIAVKRARRDALAGKKPSTQAGEFIREEMHALNKGSGNVRSRQQAIAIGLSEARRAGIKLGVPQTRSKTIRQKAAHDAAVGEGRVKPDPARSRGARKAARTKNKQYGRR